MCSFTTFLFFLNSSSIFHTFTPIRFKAKSPPSTPFLSAACQVLLRPNSEKTGLTKIIEYDRRKSITEPFNRRRTLTVSRLHHTDRDSEMPGGSDEPGE